MQKYIMTNKEKIELEAYQQYQMFSEEELHMLGYTGKWTHDKKRFIIEYEKNQEIYGTN